MDKTETRTLDIPNWPIGERAEYNTSWIDIALPIILVLMIFITVINYRYTYWKRKHKEESNGT